MMNDELGVRSESRRGVPDIRKRSYDFALRILRLRRELTKDRTGRLIASQLLRSGTSIGANVEEAQGGQSRKGFAAKMSIARKEALETGYWLRLLRDSESLPAARLSDLIDECEQIQRMLTSIVKTSKERC